MKIPCMTRLPFIVTGLSFVQSELTGIQFDNLTLIATALVLGAKFNLTQISRMWLKEKCVSTLSHFMSDAKFSTYEMQRLYIEQALLMYNIKKRKGFFVIDDTMQHHTKFCKWIHGLFVLFDHAMGTNVKSVCIVFLYYTNGDEIKFVVDFRIFYKESNEMLWRREKRHHHKTKYELAVEMLELALKRGFPKCTVLADSWFGIEPFIKELRRLHLSYVLEIKDSYTIRQPCKEPKLTPTGKLATNQYDTIKLPLFFQTISSITKCGFEADKQAGKKEKSLYHTKVITGRLNSIKGKHRIVESIDQRKKSVKYLVTNELHWETTIIISVYSYRWVIEEFFRNAKQLLDMEGATIRSEQGVTLSLCLVSWIDFLLHLENYRQRTAGKLTKDSLTIPSIVRQAQYSNLKALLDRLEKDETFVQKWLKVEKEHIEKKRKKHKQLIEIDNQDEMLFDLAA